MAIPSVEVHLGAVFVSAVVVMVLGAFWYSPVFFGNVWMRLMKFSPKQLQEAKKKGMGKAYILTFIANLVMVYVLAHIVAYTTASTVSEGLQAGFWVWLGFFATTQLGIVLWEGKPFKLYLLNTLYSLVSLLIAGAILAVWS